MPKNALTRNQQKAIAALLSKRTIAEAAQAAGLGQRTMYNYLADPTFKRALARAESEALAHVARVMAGSADLAAGVLIDIIAAQDASYREKTQAARAFLSALPNLRMLGSIEAKLSELLEDSE